jgi:hypothetical protein
MGLGRGSPACEPHHNHRAVLHDVDASPKVSDGSVGGGERERERERERREKHATVPFITQCGGDIPSPLLALLSNQ